MPFGLGRPVRSTLTLLILVPHAPLPPQTCPARSPLPPPTRPRAPYPRLRSPLSPSPPLPTLKDRGHAEGGRIRGGYDPPSGTLQVDSHSARERLANNHGAGSYGKRCPEGMLGVTSALPGTRAFTA